MANMINVIREVDPAPSVTSTDGQVRDAKLRRACADFESIFVNYVLRSARKALSQQGLFHDTREGKMYASMMDEQMAQCVARGKGLGLGALLYKQLGPQEHAIASPSAIQPLIR